MTSNSLYYGDNLDILRRYVQDESVDLIYLDPPFNSNQTYNILFQEKDGSQSAWHCQVDEKLVDRPPRYCAPARLEPTMLSIKNSRQPQLDNTAWTSMCPTRTWRGN